MDLAQAAIGPGMAVFTRYARVLDASGEAVTVREALALINQTLGRGAGGTGRATLTPTPGGRWLGSSSRGSLKAITA